MMYSKVWQFYIAVYSATPAWVYPRNVSAQNLMPPSCRYTFTPQMQPLLWWPKSAWLWQLTVRYQWDIWTWAWVCEKRHKTMCLMFNPCELSSILLLRPGPKKTITDRYNTTSIILVLYSISLVQEVQQPQWIGSYMKTDMCQRLGEKHEDWWKDGQCIV